MAKKNKKRGGQANHQEKTPEVVRRWNDYFGRGELSDWQRLCHDLGRDGNLTSKTQCRKALRGVWVNIRDFLETEHRPEDVVFFRTQQALAKYTVEQRKIFPKKRIPKGSPLGELMAHIF